MKNNCYLTDFKEKFQQYSIKKVKWASKNDAKQFQDSEKSLDLLQGHASTYTESSLCKCYFM